MFWADKLLENRKGKEVIHDAWTPSGIVHMGSLKGPVIHDVLYKILKEKGVDVIFKYGLDDADPIDGLPPDLQATYAKYLGIPIYKAPSPDGNGSFGDFFGNKMKTLLDALDIHPQIYKTSDLYINGQYNKAIQIVLYNAATIRKVYGEIYKKKIPDSWFPMQVICPTCGKLGTTKVTGWDGKMVRFSCEEKLVTWAQGCGTQGEISPFNGSGKMSWKVEWAATWWLHGVTIEGAGKDHGSAGGSYDVAMRLCKDVFGKEPPLKLVYEFFLSGGKKMSSSKGLGLTGEELVEVVGPERTRFLMVKTPPNQAVEFTPYNTDAIPKLFDDYQKVAKEEDEDISRSLVLSEVSKKEKIPQVRFSVLAQWVQMPNMEQTIKKEGLTEWAKYAKIWIDRYAPDSEKFSVQKDLPEAAKNLSEKQKEFLQKVSKELVKNWDAEAFQTKIYDIAKELGIPSKEAFAAIYLSLIGKDHGPKAGWLILSLDKEFVKKRFSQVSLRGRSEATDEAIFHKEDRNKAAAPRDDKMRGIFTIDKELKEKFPSISVGVAIIKGVSIEKTNKELETEKLSLVNSLESLTTEQLGQYPEVISYRKLYKETGVDWHSHRPSPEALLRRIALKKWLYTINTCVDAYNLVVMKHRVSIGAFDLDAIKLPTVLRFAKDSEEILLLGDESPTKYKEGEVAYFDKAGGFNMDFNYRDAQRTAVQLTTKNLYINVDGIYDITPEQVEKSLKEACDAIIKYCGGKLETFGVETAIT